MKEIVLKVIPYFVTVVPKDHPSSINQNLM